MLAFVAFVVQKAFLKAKVSQRSIIKILFYIYKYGIVISYLLEKSTMYLS